MATNAPAPNPVRTRWLGVGAASEADPERAGAEAARAALTGPDAELLLVFASAGYDLEPLVAGVAGAAPEGVPLVGCSTAGEITAAGPACGTVVVAALGGEGLSASTEAVVADGGLRDAAAEAAACLGDVAHRRHQVLLMLSDSTAGDQQEAVRGAYSVAGAGVPIVGACAGNQPGVLATSQLHGADVLTGAVVIAALGSDAPLGVGSRHGWRPAGEPMLVTRASGNRVAMLDGERALDLYLDRLAAPRAAHSDPAAFSRFALAHPIGLRRSAGEDQVRLAVAADFDSRELIFAAEVPHGGLAWLMQASADDVLAATDDACRAAVAALGGSRPAGLLAFDCIARRVVLGDGAAEEIDRIAAHADGAPLAGLYTFGEFARTRGISGFHNQTLAVLAVA